MMNIEIANRLVRLRKKNGYSQEELAARLGVSRQAISKWERAETSPDTDNLIALSRLYGISLDALLATEGETPTSAAIDEDDKADSNKSEDKSDPNKSEDESDSNKSEDGVHVSIGTKGIHVESNDGNIVHVGWDGIRVKQKEFRKGNEEECADEYVEQEENCGERVDISDIEVDESGVTFTENGERRHYDWNRFNHGKKSWYREAWDDKSGRWRTVIIDERGKKVILNFGIDHDNDDLERDASISREAVGGFPYVALVTVAFLLLGFLGGWWHPAWLLFLTIPIYYSTVNLIRRGGANAFDIIIPTLLAGGYVAIGLIYSIWSPTWLLLLGIPFYFAIAAVIRCKSKKAVISMTWFPLLVTIVYLILGFTLGTPAWRAGWLLFFTIPVFYSIVNSVKKGRGIRALSSFPWEVLIAGLYLAGGILWGWWHPGWVIFIAIPIIRWFIKLIINAVLNKRG